MKKLIPLLAITFACSHSLLAQKLLNNSVKLNVDGFIIGGGGKGSGVMYSRSNSLSLANQLGVSYERRVFKNLFVSGAYSKWVQWARPAILSNKLGYSVNEPVATPYSVTMHNGWLANTYHDRTISGAQMIDLSALYKLQVTREQTVSIGLGASFFWAKRTESYMYWWVGGDTGDVDAATTDINSLGILPQISYDHSILKNYVSIGAHTRARYYTERAGGQYDIGIHAGVNF